MVWCVYCARDEPTTHLEGKICCSGCGRVIEEDNFSSEPTFVKNAAGQSQMAGNYVKTVQSDYTASRDRTLNEAYNGIEGILYGLGIDGGDSIARPALRFYEIAVEKHFTRGRRKEQVQAACLYIACRFPLCLSPEKGGNTQSMKNMHISGSEKIGASSVAKFDHNATPDTLHGMDGMGPDDHDESDNFSDIDDVEVDGYLHNEQEKIYKKIIWETMNREYLEEQAAKEAAALDAKKKYESRFANCSEDVQEAQRIAAAAAANVKKSRMEKQQKRAAELKNSGPAKSAAEAAKQMLTKKRLSSKINYDVLEKLFDESGPENPKKTRHVDDLTDDNGVKSDKIDPEIDETYEEAFGEDVQYDEDVGGYDFDQHYNYDDY
ncbi:uncharacterized protein LOC132062089 [Lycium ferocissimum]|uniref:uncharacterized protein LOC132062089 n=1 Tax=Lycium ferocissimum TaxID=112874 RepID=UPI002816012D|nr:uncharacterized protein LOC132062089 [Lycium ferocissimum]